MKWLLLLPLFLVACAPASTGRELQEQVAVLQAQYRDLEAKSEAQDARSCRALYLSAFAAEKAGALPPGWADPILNDGWVIPGCPPWLEVNR